MAAPPEPTVGEAPAVTEAEQRHQAAIGAVSVIVPLHNGESFIGGCLASVPPEAELIVVDDASEDDAPEVVRQRFPRAVLVRNDRNLGFAATCNRGMAISTRPIKVLLNSDARLHPGVLDQLVAAFDDPTVGIAGPRLVFPGGGHQVSAASFPTPLRLLLGSLRMARRDHRVDHDVDWVMGTCLAIHERCLADVSGFDERYFLYVEETDLCWRAQQAGWRVRYVAGGTVDHDIAGSIAERSDARRHLAGEARFMLTTGGPGTLFRWRIARSVGAVLRIGALGIPALWSDGARTRLKWQLSALRNAFRVAVPVGP